MRRCITADVALVSLAIDATGVVAGERAATRSLQAVETAMEKAERQSSTFSSGLKGMSGNVSQLGASLSSVGGPIGRFGGAISGLAGQMDALTGGFGLIGGAALGAVAGVTALAGAFVRLTLEGVAVSDQMGDIAESTGLTLDAVQRLGAAAALSGEDIGLIERAFRTYQSAVVNAVKDPSSEAGLAFRTLGINAKEAGKNVGESFVGSIARLKEFSSSAVGAQASAELFGRGVGSLIRQADNLALTLSSTREELERAGIIATQAAVEAGGKLDNQIKALNNSWIVFQQNLAQSLGGKVMLSFLEDANQKLRSTDGLIDAFIKLAGAISLSNVQMQFLNAMAKEVAGGSQPQYKGLFQLGFGQVTPYTPAGPAAPPPAAVKPAKAPRAIREITEFTPEQIGDPFKRGLEMAQQEADRTAAAIEAATMKQRILTEEWLEFLRILSSGTERPVLGGPSPVQQGVAGQPFPGAPIFDKGPDAHKIRTEQQDKLDQQFNLIFDDMITSILTARATVGGAFAGFALGIVDTFAQEFTKALRTNFIDPVIKGLTELLNEAIGGLFGGLGGGKGVKGFFGGLLKGIGTIFGGLFASGGTLGPGKFGIAGERGPELLFSGSQPMHIAPVTAGSAGNVININVGVNAPAGTVDRRTQDQLAATVLNAVRRAERNMGAR